MRAIQLFATAWRPDILGSWHGMGTVPAIRIKSRARPHGARAGFTLVEAMVATTIIAVAGSALLLGVANSMNTTEMSLEQTLAAGMAEQLLNEVAARRYMQPGASPYDTNLGPGGSETAGSGRERFNDLDDYAALLNSPPRDRWGVLLGKEDQAGDQRHPHFRVMSNYFSTWRQKVHVNYVNATNLSTALGAGASSNYRQVTVTITRVDPQSGERELAKISRVFSYVPTP
jgi:prepilin-type N-terminal cleavage/methylation domain-containing protein